MTTPETSETASFDDVDHPSAMSSKKRMVDPKIVVLAAKKLRTAKEIRVILPEEEYLGKLQQIIIKDYFPELPQLRAQKDYLDAVAANDLPRIRALQQRYSTKRTERRTSPSMRQRSPGTFDLETPGPSSMAATSKSQGKEGNDEVTIDTYLNKYTSEDNASFEELAALQNKKEQLRNSWMYEAERKHNEQLVTHGPQLITAADEQLMIAAAPSTVEEKPKDLDNWTYKARNSVLFDLDEAPLTWEEHLRRQKMNERIINKEGTRLPEAVKAAVAKTPMAAPQAAARHQGKVDITGREIGAPSTDAVFDLVSTPSIAPGVDASPFMTWGEIEGTPFRLDALDIAVPDNAPAFRIPEVPVREKIAQSMSETIAKRYRERRKVAIRQAEKYHTKTPSFGSVRSSEKLLSMSPAARRLATRSLGIRLSSDKQLEASYTPSPNRTPDIASNSKGPSCEKASSKFKERSSTPVKSARSITDNLLSFGDSIDRTKWRPTASDFF